MKQETSNTFEGGMNKDLNPIVTPNDVLTDCLNGTFITFNGDELSLQNDAGNTKITVPWDKGMLLEYTEGASYNSGVVVEIDKIMYRSLIDSNTKPVFNEDNSLNEAYWELFDPSVKLSDGFYPIGIREYGGVLYIVSANKETNKVEFGSYPAPILSKGGLMPGHDVKITSESKDHLLYETVLLNDYSFKTGGYATFNNLNADSVEHLQIPPSKSSEGRKGMYRVRLIHQLNNGSFDLTEDVWEKFFEHKENSGTEKIHWIDSVDGDKTFKYLCPNQYKGKLAIIVELDEPPVFKFNLLPTIELKENNYEVTLNNIDYESSDSIPITGFNWILTYSDGTQTEGTQGFPEPGESFPIKVDPKYNLVTYEITPETGYNWENFPKVFKDKYTLRGTVLLAEKYYSIYLERVSGSCKPSTSEKEYRMLVLYNSSGELGIDFENTLGAEKAVVFLLEGHSLTEEEEKKYLVLGRYGIVENKASLLRLDTTYESDIKALPEGEELLKIVKSKLEETTVLEKDVSCGSINITIKFNLGFDLKTPTEVEEGRLKFYQKDGNTSREMPFTVVDYRTFEVEVSADKDLYIWARMGHIDIWEFKLSKEDYSEGEIYNYAITMEPLTYNMSGTVLPTYLDFQTNWVDYANAKTISTYAPEIHTTFLPEENEGREMLGYKGKSGYSTANNSSTMLIRTENPGINNIGLHTSAKGEIIQHEYKNLLPDKWLKVGDDDLGYLIVPVKPAFRIWFL